MPQIIQYWRLLLTLLKKVARSQCVLVLSNEGNLTKENGIFVQKHQQSLRLNYACQ